MENITAMRGPDAPSGGSPGTGDPGQPELWLLLRALVLMVMAVTMKPLVSAGRQRQKGRRSGGR